MLIRFSDVLILQDATNSCSKVDSELKHYCVG